MGEVKKVRYIIEIEADIEGEVDKLREVCSAAIEGAEVNITDIIGVESATAKLVKATQLIEEDLDLEAAKNPLEV